jgi:membrane glycosyltransferase
MAGGDPVGGRQAAGLEPQSRVSCSRCWLISAVTAVTAPITMMNFAGSILSTLMGVDGGWRPQVRDRNGFAWMDLVRHYMQHMIFGFVLLVACFAISPTFMLQNAPLACALMLAPLITRQLSMVARRGSTLWHLFATPEDLNQPRYRSRG